MSYRVSGQKKILHLLYLLSFVFLYVLGFFLFECGTNIFVSDSRMSRSSTGGKFGIFPTANISIASMGKIIPAFQLTEDIAGMICKASTFISRFEDKGLNWVQQCLTDMCTNRSLGCHLNISFFDQINQKIQISSK